MAYGLSERGIIGSFLHSYGRPPANSWVTPGGPNSLVTFLDSQQPTETIRFLGGTPGFREWRGDRQNVRLRTDEIQITQLVWEDSIGETVENWVNDRTGQFMIRAGELGNQASWMHQTKHFSELIREGDTTTFKPSWDGQAYFSATHSVGDSGTYSNLLTLTEVPALDVANAAAPTGFEAALAILGVINHMRSALNDRGDPVNEDAMSWACMYPTTLGSGFDMALQETTVYTTSMLALPNPLGIGRALTIAALPNVRLNADPATFYVFRTDGPGGVRPLIQIQDGMPKMTFLGPDSEYAYVRNEVSFGAKVVRGFGYGEHLHAARATLS